MAEFTVTVEGKDYDVTAPDERTAWGWANHAHRQAVSSAATKPILTPEQISAHGRQAGISSARGESPILARGAEVLTGMTGLMRGGANLVSEGLGEKIWPPAGPSESGYRMAGQIADPLAWTIAGSVGKALPFAPVIGKGIKEGAKALGRNILSGGTIGGTIGALSEEGDVVTGAGAGAVVGPVAPAVVSAVRGGGRILRDLFYPEPARLAVKAAGKKASDVIAAMLRSESGVPGVNLTAGQAAVPAGSAEFAALQKMVSSRDPSLYFGAQGIAGQQEAARRAAVQTIGRTPQELAAAIKGRSTASAANYAEAFEQEIKRDKELRTLWKNPYFKKEVGEAWTLLKAEANKRGEKMPLLKNLTQFLQFVKEGLDASIESATRPDAPAISKSAKAAMLDVKQRLVDWLGTKNPAYEAARLEHIELSQPINQMKMGQELQRALSAPMSEAERPAALAAAIRKAETTMSKATGRPRIEALTPEQRETLDVLQANLKTGREYEVLARAGRENVESRMGAPTAPPTGLFYPLLSAARSWLNRLLGTGHENALQTLAPMMAQDPQKFARLMQAATPEQRAALGPLLQRLNQGAIIGATNVRPGDDEAHRRAALAGAIQQAQQ